jgi:hypothetical protein
MNRNDNNHRHTNTLLGRLEHMDHGGDTEPHREDLGEVIENMIEAESSLLAA